MATVWFNTPSAGRGRLRAAALTGLSIDGPRHVVRQRPVTVARRDDGTFSPPRRAAAPREASHDFALEPAPAR